jgi:hypothetical protein
LIKNLLLLVTSIVIAVLVFVGIYEGIESSKYDTWKANVFAAIRNQKIQMEEMGIDFHIAMVSILDSKNSTV